MTDQHPITPPPELLKQWEDDWLDERENVDVLLLQAAQWGADQELEACREWVAVESIAAATELRAWRRPKPPSLKEQALEHLEQLHANAYSMGMGFDPSIIRRALEQLDD